MSISNNGITHQYVNNDLAFMQYQGDIEENPGGSEKNWELAGGSAWRSGFYPCVSSSINIDNPAAQGAHMVNPDSVGGNVFYLGGHDHSPFDNLLSINAARMYLNASLLPAGKPTNFALIPGDTANICLGDSVQLGGSPTGPAGSSFQWSPGSTLDDSTVANPWAKPTDTTTYAVIASNGGCVVGPLTVTVNVNSPSSANAGNDTTICAEVAVLPVSGSVINATGGIWSTTTGTGTFDDVNDLTTNYNSTVADTALGSIYIKLTTVGAVGCSDKADSLLLTFTPSPDALAGPNVSKCANNAVTVLAGVIYNSGGGIWTTGGTGTFVLDTDPTTTYTPSGADTAAGAVTLTLTTTGMGGCALDSDPMTITLTDAPLVFAGADVSVCADTPSVPVSGTVAVATGGAWTSDGTGTFAVPGDLSTTFDPSDADTADGFIIITLTSTGNFNCAAESDVMNLTITAVPTANAGPNQSVCGNNADAIMAGSITTATGVLWTTSGTGSFDDNTSLVAIYTPSVADTGAGSVTLTMTTTGNGSCGAVVATMTLTITDAPIAYAGVDQSVCANNEVVTISGVVSVAGDGNWLTLGGGSFGNPLLLATTYTPSAADIALGTDTIVLTTTLNGSCNAVTDTLVITITVAPTSDADIDQTVCANNNVVTLSGAVTLPATGGVWSTGAGDGVFVDPTDLLTNYTPGPGDIGVGTVTLTLTTSGSAPSCVEVTNDMAITIDPIPTVSAGLDQTKCSNNRVTSLAGSFTIATSVLWTSTGTGAFVDDTNPITTYTPSDADTVNGTDTLILTTTGPVLCNSEVDTMIITLTKAPVALANIDQTVCADAPAITLAGTVYSSATVLWTVTFPVVPDGSFDNPTLLGAVYTPGAGDIAGGTVTFQLATTGNGPCVEVTDAMTTTINPVATTSAGADATICAGATHTLVGLMGGAASSILWTTSGTGTFDDNTALGAIYTPSDADTAAAGPIILTITTDDPDGAGPCAVATDAMNLTINPEALVGAGGDQAICAGTAATLAGTKGGSTSTTTWTTSGTGTFDNDALLGAVYTPSDADTAAPGIITLTITTNDPDGAGPCAAIADAMTLTINPEALVGAGADATICAGTTHTLAGTKGGATATTTWTTSGTGTFDNDAILGAVYTPSDADTAAPGIITLTITTNDPDGAGPCAAIADAMTLTINPEALVGAGADATICSGTTFTTLGTKGGATSTT
ncbi:MAG: hypothetical protein JKY27_09030, partial [Magnetovibrio sp.]|nr:hypothetical protein [Magnetovibrio sp.]